MSLYGYNPKWKKALWVKAAPAQPSIARRAPARQKRVRKVSRARAAIRPAYKAVRDAFVRANPVCHACPKRGITPPRWTVDPHHTRGRAGPLLMDTRFWIPVCRSCHDWIGDNYAQAQALGLICAKGLWNTPER